MQFGDKHPPVLVPADRRRRRNERLAGDDLQAKAIRQLERRGALLGSQRLGRVGGFRNLREGEMSGEQHEPRKRWRFQASPA